jgi:hypothetical protein
MNVHARLAALSLALLLGGLAIARADDKKEPVVEPALGKPALGEWVFQRDTDFTTGKPQSIGLYMWVSKIGENTIEISTQSVSEDGKTGFTAARTSTRANLGDQRCDPAALDKKFPTETIEVSGKSWKCWRLGGKAHCTWVSAAAPVNGTVQVVELDKTGKTIRQSVVVEWGTSGGAAKPLK